MGDKEQLVPQADSSAASSRSAYRDDKEQAALAARAAALWLEPRYFRSKLQELLLLMPGVSQDRLLSLRDSELKSLIRSTATVAARLVQLRTRWTTSPASPAASQPQQQAKRDSLGFLWKDPKLLARGDWDSFVTRTPVASLYGHTGTVTSVAVTPDGRRAVSGSWDKTLRMWNLQARTCVASLQGHSSWVLSVAITPDGRHAVSGSLDTTLRVWDLHSYTCVATLKGHTGGVNAAAITPDSCYAVSGSEDKTLRVWDLRTYTCSATLTGHAAGVTSVAITPDGCSAVSGSEDKTLRLWDLQACTCTATLDSMPRSAVSVAITPDGGASVSGGWAGALAVWDLQTRCCARPDDWFLYPHTFSSHTLALTPNGGHAVLGGWSSSLHVWDLLADPWPVGTPLTTVLEGHTADVKSVAITPDGCYAVSGSSNASLCVWDLRPHTCRPSLCRMVLEHVARASPTSQWGQVQGTALSPALLVSARLRIFGQYTKYVLMVLSPILLIGLLFYFVDWFLP